MTFNPKYTALLNLQSQLGWVPCEPLSPGELAIFTSAPIQRPYLPRQVQTALEEKGVPLSGAHPFGANWAALIEPLNPHACAWIATLVYVEWGLMYWAASATRAGILDRLVRKNEMWGFFRERGMQPESGSSTGDLQIKWWLDDLALRLRAIWDKLPHAIAESSDPRIELSSKQHDKRVRELARRKPELGLGPESSELLDSLIVQMGDIDYLRAYRDAESHRHVHPFAEVFGVYQKHESLVDTWPVLLGEYCRCREAIMAAIALVVVRDT